ncbi:MAG: conserved repeat domain protein, partial [Polaromonas sp.]|nr:conserved repeat domain protein [Polaromonas sp.]
NSAQPVSATNNDIVTIGSNAVMTLTKSASYPGLVIPGTTDITFTVTGASIGAQDAGPTSKAATAALTSDIVVDGVPQTLVLIRDLIPAGTTYNAGTLSSTPAGAIKLFRKAGDAAYSYSSTDPGALAVEVAVGVPSALVRNGTLAMSFGVRVLATQTGNIVNTSQSYYADGPTPQEAQSNTVVIVPTILKNAIGLAKAASAPVVNLNAQGQPDGTASVNYTVRARNYGQTPLFHVQINDLLEGTVFGAYTQATAPGANQYTVVAGSLAISNPSGGATAAVNPAFTGKAAAQNLLAAGAALPVGAEFAVNFSLRINLGGRAATLLNQARGVSAKEVGGATDVTDDSTNGTDPDPDGDKDPGTNSVPTPVIIGAISPPVVELPSRIGLAKSARTPIVNQNAQGQPDGTVSVTYLVRAKNYGEAPLYDVQVSDLLEGATFGAYTTATVPAANQYTVEAGTLAVNNPLGGATAAINPAYTGQAGALNLLAPGATLPLGAEFTVSFTLRINLGGRGGTLFNQAVGVAAKVAGGTADIPDDSTDGVNPDPDGDNAPGNNSVPTPVVIAAPVKASALGLAKSASAPVANLDALGKPDGTYTVAYSVRAKNYGDITLHDVQVSDLLEGATFGAYTTAAVPLANQYTVVAGSLGMTGLLGGATAAINPTFTGKAAAQKLVAAGATLPVGAEFTVKFTLRLNIGGRAATLLNQAKGVAAKTPGGPVDVTDESTTGINPDPDGDNAPGNNGDPTPVTIDKTVLPSVIGLAKSAGNPVTNVNAQGQPDGTYSITYNVRAKNYGQTALYDVQINDLLEGTTFGTYTALAVPAANQYTVVAGSVAISGQSGNPVATANTAFTGTATAQNLLKAGAELPVGADVTVKFTLRVNLGGRGGTLLNQSKGVAARVAGGPGDVTDDSTDGLNPDPDSDNSPGNNSVPTPVVIVKPALTSAIGLAKSASAPVVNLDAQGQPDGTASVIYSIRAKNYGQTTLHDVQISDLLQGSVFGAYTALAVPAANQYTVVAGSLAIRGQSGEPVAFANAAYTGQAAMQNLLTNGATLPVGAEFTVSFTLRINLGGRGATLLNQAKGVAAKVPGGPGDVTDDSTNGTNPDPDDDNTPGNNTVPTPVTIEPILVSRIGIAKAASIVLAPANAQGDADGTVIVRTTLRVKNHGQTLLQDVNVEDLMEGASATQFGTYTASAVPAANQYTIVAGSLSVTAATGIAGSLQLDPAFTGQGAHQKLLASGARLPAGSEFTLQFDIRVHVLSRSGMLLNTARTSGALTPGGPVVATDLSADGVDTDPDKDGDPTNNNVPTPVSTALPVLKLVKTASVPRPVGPDTFDIDFTLTVGNAGNAPAPAVRLIDNLNCTFDMDLAGGHVSSWELRGAPVSLGGVLRPLAGFTGRAACDRAGLANPNLAASVPTDPALGLVDGAVALAPGQSDTVRFTTRLTLKPASLGQRILLSNQAWGTSTGAPGEGMVARLVAVTSASAAVLLADPTGVVYDALSRQPIEGAVVTLGRTGACAAGSTISSVQLFGGSTPGKYTYNADGSVSMTTGADGVYQFLLATSETCTYALKVAPPAGSGYVFTSRLIPAQSGTFASCGPVTGVPAAPQGGQDTRHYLSISGGATPAAGGTGASYCSVSHNHIPLDPGNPEGLVLKKEGSKTQVEFGDFLDYGLTASNKTGFALSGIRFTDTLPPGFAYVPGSARLNGQPVADPAGGVGPSLVWSFANLALAPQASATVRYRVRIGVGAPTEGEAINRARATSGPNQQIESNQATWKVRISGGVFADDAYAFGKVMLNCKRDGVQNANDDQGKPGTTDLGIPGVRLYLETGTFVVTDSEGKWSLYGLKPMTHVLRLDPTTLPAGARLEVLDNRNAGNPESRFLDLKKGEFAKANFIVGNCDDTAMLKDVDARRAAATTGTDPLEGLARSRLDAEGRILRTTGDLRGMPASGQIAGGNVLGAAMATGTIENSSPLIALPGAPAGTASTFVGASTGGLSGTLGASASGASFANAAPAGSLFRPVQGMAAGAQPESVVNSGTVPGTMGSNALNTQTAPLAPLAQPLLPLAAPESVELETLIPGLDNTLGFIGLKSGDTVASQQINVRVKGVEGSSLRLTVNGVAIEDRRVGKKSTLPSKRITAWEYIGVALKPGANTLRLDAVDDFGNVRGSQDITLTAPDKLSLIKIELPESARADLRTPVIVKVRLSDASGVPVTARTQLTLEADRGRWLDEDLNPLEPGHQVFMDGGQAQFSLLPPGEPGDARVRVSAGNLVSEVRLSLLPEIRPVIAVGIVEGTLDFTRRGGLAVGEVPAGAAFERELTGLVADGNDSARAAARTAFFLKGTVRGDYLLTAAFDSDKTTKDRLFRDIRPDEFYPIYGDSSAKGFDAQSTQKLYLRIDKNRSYLLYGDFTTTSSAEVRQLSQSNRTLTGVKNVYENGQVRATSYASRTAQTREVEEFRAVGTSGPYFLSAARGDVVDNSERVEILVRDRNQPALVLQTTAVTRNVDYTIEPLTRRILFTRAISSIDGNLNPQSIRVSYEVDSGGDKFTVAGTDVQVKVGENLQLGVVASIDNNPENQRKLQAVTAIARLGANTSVASEVVRTESDLKGTGNAARVELRYQDEQLAAVALASKTDAAFDNPGASAAAGRTEAAVRAEYKVDATTAVRAEATYSKDEAAGATNSAKSLSASVQKKIGDTLVAEVGVRHGQNTSGSNAGFDYGQVSTVNGTLGGTNGTNSAGIVTPVGGASQQTEDVTTVRARLTSQVPGLPQAQVFAEAEQDVSHSDRHVFALGGNYALTSKTRAYGRYELVSTLASPDTLSTTGRTTGVLGIESNYMEGGRVYNEFRLADAIDGRSAQSAMGLRNTVKLGGNWRATGGIEHTRTLGGTSGNTGTGVAGVANNDSTAIVSGVEYLGERIKASGVAEARVGSDAHTRLFSLGAAYKLDADWSLLGRAIYSNSEGQGTNEGNDRLLSRYQIGVALRPVGQDVWNALARYEHKSERVRGAGTAAGAADLGSFSSATLPGNYSTDIVSAHVNYNPERGQVITGRYAGKVSRADDGVTDSRYWANLLHARYTQDLSKDWDLGVQAGYLWGKGGARERTLGLEVGYQAMKDLWISAGYNWLGLKD